MRRAGAFLALVAMTALPLGAAAAAASVPGPDCAEEALACCGLDCAFCFCCSVTAPVLMGASPVVFTPPPSSGLDGSLAVDGPCPDPRPILHVPRVPVAS
jgi:hypothetical protein